MWEILVRLAILLCGCSGYLQLTYGLDINQDSLGDLLSFAGSFAFAYDIFRCQIFSVRVYWRTISLFLVSLFCSWVYVCISIRPFVEQCENGWHRPLLESTRLIVETSLWLHAILRMPLILLVSSILTAIVVLIFPVPNMPALKNKKYSRVGTLNFTIPMKLSGAESQLYKGGGVHTCDGDHDGEIEEYDLNVQCWFPVLSQESSGSSYWRYFGLMPCSTMWSSGHPAHQDNEASYLLRRVALLGGLPSLLLSQLALTKTHAEYFHGIERMFGLKENPVSLEGLCAKEDIDKISVSNILPTGPESTTFTPAGTLPIFVDKDTSLNNTLQHVPLFPIAIYSHGNYGWRQLASTSCEALASQGFVVFSMDHAPSCLSARPLPVVDKSSTTTSNQSDAAYHGFTDFDYALPKDITPSTIEERDFFAGGIDRRVREVQCLIDHLCTSLDKDGVATDGYGSEDSSEYKESDYYSNNIDNVSTAGSADGDRVTSASKSIGKTQFHANVDKICLFGHSFGAGTSIAATCRDPRVRAVCALDAWLYPAKDAYSGDSLYTGFRADGSVDRSSNYSRDSHNTEPLTPVRQRSRASSRLSSPKTPDAEDIFPHDTRKACSNVAVDEVLKEETGSTENTQPSTAIKDGNASSMPSDAYPDSACRLPSQEHLSSPFGPKVLFLTSDKWPIAAYQAPFRHTFLKKCHRNNVFNIVILDTSHQNFCDTHLLARPFLMRGGSKLDKVDPFDNVEAMNEVLCNFFMQACDSSLHFYSINKDAATIMGNEKNALGSTPRESDVSRLSRYLHLGQNFKGDFIESMQGKGNKGEGNAANNVNVNSPGLVLTSSVRSHYVSKRTDSFISTYYRDETSLPNNMNWKYHHWCLPHEPLRSLVKSCSDNK